jgi:hypothetical protein
MYPSFQYAHTTHTTTCTVYTHLVQAATNLDVPPRGNHHTLTRVEAKIEHQHMKLWLPEVY